MPLYRLSQVILALTACAAGVIVLENMTLSLESFLLWLWLISPQICLLNTLLNVPQDKLGWWIISLQMFLGLYSTYIYYDLFYINIDALNGLLFVLIPLYQLLLFIAIGTLFNVTQLIQALYKKLSTRQ